jgi:hypothetical protein
MGSKPLPLFVPENEVRGNTFSLSLGPRMLWSVTASERPQGLMVLERLVGQFKLGDVEITERADKHKCDPAADRQADSASGNHAEIYPPNNIISSITRFRLLRPVACGSLFWGDNRPVPDPSVDHFLNHVDVLILPVETVLTRSEADAIVQRYDPKAVIPAHYFVKGLTTEVSGLESADPWVTAREKLTGADVRRLDSAELTLSPAQLNGAHHRLYYFGNHFEKN